MEPFNLVDSGILSLWWRVRSRPLCPNAHVIPNILEQRGIYIEIQTSSILKPGTSRTPMTWSSWVMNMCGLSALIDESRDIIAAAEPGLDLFTINYQVSELREHLKKQGEHVIALLRLIKDYSDRVLSDISEEIQQQSSLLDALERRVDMAKGMREEVVHLLRSYEAGTLDYIKKLRRTGLSEPLPEDVALFRKMDIIGNEMRRCYIEMDKFWVDEVGRATRALKNRRIDPEDINRWKIFQENLEHVIVDWETSSMDDLNVVALQPTTHVPVHDLRPTVSSLAVVAKAAQCVLNNVRGCASVGIEFVKPVHYSLILQAEVKFSENRASCAEFLQKCVRFGKAVVMTCEAFASYSPFSRTRNSQDLVDRATRLATDRIEISAQPTIQMRGMRKFNSIRKKVLSSLRSMDHKLNTAFNCIPSWVSELDAHSTFPAFDIKRLQSISCVWLKNRDAIEHVLASLSFVDESSGRLTPLETRL